MQEYAECRQAVCHLFWEQVFGSSILSTLTKHKAQISSDLSAQRAWYSGCALAFQANESGSIPDARSNSR